MGWRKSEWPKVAALLTCGLAASALQDAHAYEGGPTEQDELQALCQAHDVKHCPELVYTSRNKLNGKQGLTSCSRFKETKERVCFRIALDVFAPKDTLQHEFAHVLQWLSGAPQLNHGHSFKQAQRRLK